MRLRPLRLFLRAVHALRRAPAPALVSAATIGVVIFLFGGFWLTGQSVRRGLVGWAGEGEALTVYARRGVDAGGVDRLRRDIGALPGVAAVRAISPAEAMAELEIALGENGGALLEGIEPEAVLAPMFSVSLVEAGPEAARDLVAQLRRLAGVESVESDAAWLERYSRILDLGWWLGLGWGALLGTGALLVVGNTARLAALTRREEIEVLRLVGASDSFIVIPFFWEGALQGVLGSALGLALLRAVFEIVGRSLGADPLFAPLLGTMRFLDPYAAASLAAAGPALGGLGSLAAALRFLRGTAP